MRGRRPNFGVHTELAGGRAQGGAPVREVQGGGSSTRGAGRGTRHRGARPLPL
jgi:hypothetical protein